MEIVLSEDFNGIETFLFAPLVKNSYTPRLYGIPLRSR
jgi:hypothetical protein